MKKKLDRWAEVFARLDELANMRVQVGWFDEDAATIAYINDRGGNRGDNPPPRPVLGPGLDAAQNAVMRAMAKGVSDVIRGRSPHDAAQRMGEAGEQGVRDAIDAVQPPNADSTIASKHGYSAPLRGFSPDRIWNKLEWRLVSANDAAGDEDLT